ncbi:MAG: glycosyl transferase family 1 [Ignavibacteriae bacterium]|nr:glycosyl transferase family 1 [Ignavibacteriota bacterium]
MNKSGLYIQLYNIHGLIRGKNLELGRDADTGGQTKYVLELAKSLTEREDVRKVEIVTRRIEDKAVSKDYSDRIENVSEKLSIIRIRCGGLKYIRKELLWPHLEEFVDKSIKYIKGNNELPDIIHSHYADAGYVCTELTKFFGIPLIHTGHSLGRDKLNNLLKQGLTKEEINKRYKIFKRIEAEESTIFFADRIITSTNQEIDKQYGLYENTNKDKFVVIPPSVELKRFYPYNEKREWNSEEKEIREKIREELWRFFTNLNKPLILSLCRPEKRKNITGLIEAYGEDKELQKKANLAIFAGIRKDITKMEDIEREVLTEILLMMDKYNLYGKMAVPKTHDVEDEVPELYRITAETRGVFVNSAYNEPFGLTLIEAASSGLPVVATNDGGPKDILNNLNNGELVDVSDSKNIANGIHKILDDEDKWIKYSGNGIERVKKYYSWEAHTDLYVEVINEVLSKVDRKTKTFISTGEKFLTFEKFMIFDIDDTLLGNKEAAERIKTVIAENNNKIGFGVATGRTIDSAKNVLKENNFVLPDLIISSVGSEIYYRDHEDYILSTGWKAHISQGWKREQIFNALSQFDFLEYQEEDTQRDFKVSYYIDKAEDNYKKVVDWLVKNRVKANCILSHKNYLDILPARASKGRAVRYIAYRWNLNHNNILVAGDSGNDEDMLTGELLGVVVGNYGDELNKLKGRRRIYFAEAERADGIIEGINYYNFIERI